MKKELVGHLRLTGIIKTAKESRRGKRAPTLHLKNDQELSGGKTAASEVTTTGERRLYPKIAASQEKKGGGGHKLERTRQRIV